MGAASCLHCDGTGIICGDICITCGGSGHDPALCEKCDEPAVGFNDDSEYLCEDCLSEWVMYDDEQ